jgi:hypothetical protein
MSNRNEEWSAHVSSRIVEAINHIPLILRHHQEGEGERKQGVEGSEGREGEGGEGEGREGEGKGLEHQFSFKNETKKLHAFTALLLLAGEDPSLGVGVRVVVGKKEEGTVVESTPGTDHVHVLLDSQVRNFLEKENPEFYAISIMDLAERIPVASLVTHSSASAFRSFGLATDKIFAKILPSLESLILDSECYPNSYMYQQFKLLSVKV